MRNLENDPEHWARVGWEYYGRYCQVQHLNELLMRQAFNEKIAFEKDLALFYFLMYVPGYGVEHHLSKCSDSRETHLENVRRAVTYIVKTSRLAALLDRFQECAQAGAGTREISLGQDHDLTAYFQRLRLPRVERGALSVVAPKLTEQPDILTVRALDEGKIQASLWLLGGLQKTGVDLNAWPLRVALRMTAMKRSPAINNGLIGILETAFDGVETRYYYPPQVEEPDISLVVKSL